MLGDADGEVGAESRQVEVVRGDGGDGFREILDLGFFGLGRGEFDLLLLFAVGGGAQVDVELFVAVLVGIVVAVDFGFNLHHFWRYIN